MLKILHVEDDADIREIAQMALELSGDFEVVQCVSGESALETINDFTPDVLLLDMMMPGMTGQQTLEHIRKRPHLAEIPAIFMTARAQRAEIQEFKDLGAADVISKPFDPITLGDQIKAILAALGR